MGIHVNKRINTQVHSEETRAKIGIASKVRANTKFPCEYACGLEGNKATLAKHIKSVHTFVCKVPSCILGPHKARGFCLFHWNIDTSMHRFGLTIFDYYQMYEDQNGKCLICQKDGFRKREGNLTNGMDVLCVDHCHDTGKARGLLCSLCNTALGYFRDSSESLLRASKYLEGTL